MKETSWWKEYIKIIKQHFQPPWLFLYPKYPIYWSLNAKPSTDLVLKCITPIRKSHEERNIIEYHNNTLDHIFSFQAPSLRESCIFCLSFCFTLCMIHLWKPHKEKNIIHWRTEGGKVLFLVLICISLTLSLLIGEIIDCEHTKILGCYTNGAKYSWGWVGWNDKLWLLEILGQNLHWYKLYTQTNNPLILWLD